MKRFLTTAVCTLSIAIGLAACSTAFLYDYDVEIAEGLDVPEGTSLIMISVPGGGDIQDGGALDHEAAYDPATAEYSGEGSTCCGPSETVSFFAFADLDGNDEWDPGEPLGADPNNPVEISNDGYVAKIVIEADG